MAMGTVGKTGPVLKVTPEAGPLTTQFNIWAGGFNPGDRVRISSSLLDDAGVEWRAHGEFVADAKGEIDLSDAPSEGGTFEGVDPAGLFWSMQPPSGTDRSFMINGVQKAHKLGSPHCDPVNPTKVAFTAECGGAVQASATVTLQRLDPGVDMVPVSHGRLRGMAFRWKDRSRRRGAIMSLTGSGGGLELSYAPALASLGYDVLSLAYFAYEGVPDTLASIPLEYFEEGFQWMRREFGAEKICVQGASRGGELSLVLAAYLPEYVNGAVPIVPMYAASCGWDHNSGAVGPSWTFRGKEIPYAKSLNLTGMEDMKRIGELEPNGFALTPDYRADMDQPETHEKAAIPIERASGPLLLISGEDDQMWPSAWGADLVVNRLRAKGFAHSYKHLALADSGHMTPLPNTVTTFCRAVFHSLANIFLACGGSPQNTARNSRIMWNELTAFYRSVFGH